MVFPEIKLLKMLFMDMNWLTNKMMGEKQQKHLRAALYDTQKEFLNKKIKIGVGGLLAPGEYKYINFSLNEINTAIDKINNKELSKRELNIFVAGAININDSFSRKEPAPSFATLVRMLRDGVNNIFKDSFLEKHSRSLLIGYNNRTSNTWMFSSYCYAIVIHFYYSVNNFYYINQKSIFFSYIFLYLIIMVAEFFKGPVNFLKTESGFFSAQKSAIYNRRKFSECY